MICNEVAETDNICRNVIAAEIKLTYIPGSSMHFHRQEVLGQRVQIIDTKYHPIVLGLELAVVLRQAMQAWL